VHHTERVFTNDPDSVTGIAARSFSMWTLLTCTICLLTAFNLCNKQLYYLWYACAPPLSL
jgi:hypothetical protein